MICYCTDSCFCGARREERHRVELSKAREVAFQEGYEAARNELAKKLGRRALAELDAL